MKISYSDYYYSSSYKTYYSIIIKELILISTVSSIVKNEYLICKKSSCILALRILTFLSK